MVVLGLPDPRCETTHRSVAVVQSIPPSYLTLVAIALFSRRQLERWNPPHAEGPAGVIRRLQRPLVGVGGGLAPHEPVAVCAVGVSDGADDLCEVGREIGRAH